MNAKVECPNISMVTTTAIEDKSTIKMIISESFYQKLPRLLANATLDNADNNASVDMLEVRAATIRYFQPRNSSYVVCLCPLSGTAGTLLQRR